MSNNVHPLEAQNAPVKSFRDKAEVEYIDNGFFTQKNLWSYGDVVASYGLINNEAGEGFGVLLTPDWDKSNTTLRHVREFICQCLGYKWDEVYKKSIVELALDIDEDYKFIPSIEAWYPND